MLRCFQINIISSLWGSAVNILSRLSLNTLLIQWESFRSFLSLVKNVSSLKPRNIELISFLILDLHILVLSPYLFNCIYKDW